MILRSFTGGQTGLRFLLVFLSLPVFAGFGFLVNFFTKQNEKNMDKALRRAIPKDDIREKFMQDQTAFQEVVRECSPPFRYFEK